MSGSRKTKIEISQRAAEQAARLAYGRLLAALCQNGASLSEAEDALGDAFVRALDRWPIKGVPKSPDAWLLTTARRIVIDQARHANVVKRSQATRELEVQPGSFCSELVPIIEELAERDCDINDRRIELMMLCAHPEIAANARAPLMLQSVLGLTVQKMSAAFLVSPSALGQRLARAKKSIAKKALPFSVPDAATRAERVCDVLEATYAAFSTAYETLESAKDSRHGLAHEAIWLGQILAHQLKHHAEAHGLLSLMLFIQARVHARRDDKNNFVPLSAQDRNLWDWRLIAAAEHHLGKATDLKAPGRFQIEAAIQSHHVQYEGKGPDWNAVCVLYDALVVRAPTLAAWVGRAAALGEAKGSEAGLEALSHIPAERVIGYQPYWAVSAHLSRQAGDKQAAESAYIRAIGLCEDQAVRRYLVGQKSTL
ncbi:MAG: RNA polymerase sigma factor [Gammaproteobacteria bacterium]